MAKIPKNISIKATPGRNERVDPVVRLEDLLARMTPPQAPKAVRGRGAATTKASGEWGAAGQLAAELEARLRALRGASAGSGKKR